MMPEKRMEEHEMMRFLESAWRLTRSGAAVAIVVVLAACTTQSEVNTLQTKTVEMRSRNWSGNWS